MSIREPPTNLRVSRGSRFDTAHHKTAAADPENIPDGLQTAADLLLI